MYKMKTNNVYEVGSTDLVYKADSFMDAIEYIVWSGKQNLIVRHY